MFLMQIVLSWDDITNYIIILKYDQIAHLIIRIIQNNLNIILLYNNYIMSFRYNDNLSSMLKTSTINPYREKNPYDSFENYFHDLVREEQIEYEIVSPNNKQNTLPFKESTTESIKNSNNPTTNNYITLSTILTNPKITTVENIENHQSDEDKSNESNNNDDQSKPDENVNIGFTNTIYIGSITILGLYVLYRYMHASK